MNVEIVLPELHKAQKQIVKTAKRFNHVQCGRRFGKSELIKELTDPVLDGYPIAVFCPIERDFLRTWEELKTLYRDIIVKKDETYHMMELITKGVIHMWSMKAVDNGRGEKYKRVILDEFAKAQNGRKSWEDTIRATLTDYRGDAWFLSTPKGKGNYFFELKVNNKDSEEWKFHKFTTYDNPYIAKEEIEQAKQDLDKITFAQEYLAEDVDRNEKPFLYSFDDSKHVKSCKLDKSLPVWLSFDFNVLPQTCQVAQRPDSNTLKIITSVRLDNSSMYEMCDYIKAKYPYYLITTGDATGRNRSSASNLSNWQIIRKELKLKDSQIVLRSKNLDHRTSQVICNSVLEHKNIEIDPSCTELIQDCIYASTDEHGKLIKTQDRGLHHFDGFRYLLDACWPNINNHR